jgi:signal transduction histidine kinase
LALMDVRQILEGKRTPGDLQKVAERLHYIMDQSMEAAQKIEAIRTLWDVSPLAREPVYFDALVRRAAEGQDTYFQKIGAVLEVSIAENLTRMLGNPRQLEIVAANLLKNAREAVETLAPGRERKVQLSLKQEGSQLELVIKDTGPGIDPNDLPKLFLPYFSTKGSKGMGVGLYLAREIAQAHGGSLESVSAPGKGAEFLLRLPVDR